MYKLILDICHYVLGIAFIVGPLCWNDESIINDVLEQVGKPSDTDPIKSKIPSKTFRGKMDSITRHLH